MKLGAIKISDISSLRPIKEIEKEMNRLTNIKDLDKKIKLGYEKLNTIHQMAYAVEEGNLLKIEALELLGIDSVEFFQTAVDHQQQMVLSYQLSKGASINKVIRYARENYKWEILQWAVGWKSANKLRKKLAIKNPTPVGKRNKI